MSMIVNIKQESEYKMKYELLKDDFKTIDYVTVYRIKAVADFGDVKAGDLGGYVSDAFCLINSLDDSSWIDSDSLVINSKLENTKVINSKILYSYINGSNINNSNIKYSKIFNCNITFSYINNCKKYNEIINNGKIKQESKYKMKDKLKKIAKNISNIICFFIAGIALYTAPAAFFGIVTIKEALYILLSSACFLTFYICVNIIIMNSKLKNEAQK